MKSSSRTPDATKRNLGIRAVGGLSGTLFGSFRPLGSAVGLMSALASGGVARAAQDPVQVPGPAPSSPAVGGASATAAEPLVLPTVHVEGKADSYRTEKSAISRVATPLVNTPQAVAVVPKQMIEEQRATTVRDALRNVSGITVAAGEGGRQGDTFILRGFSGQNDIFRDGSRDLGWFTRDTFNLEGVEVFFGPSAVVFGRGSTGGAVNLVTKTPKKGTFADIKLSGASAPQGRIEADVNHAVHERIQLRATAMGQKGGVAGRDKVEANRAGFAPSVRFELGDDTRLGLDYLYQRERSIPDYGVPFVGGVPVASGYGVSRETFYGIEGADTEAVDAHIATSRFEHDWGKHLHFSNSFRFGVVDRLARPTAPRNLAPAASPTTLDRQRFETETDNLNLIDQSDLRADFATGILKHAANLGVELSRERRKQTRYNFSVAGPGGAAANLTADLHNPDPAPSLANVNRVFNSYTRALQQSAAVYAADQVAIGPYFEVLGSLRLDSFGTDYRGLNAQGTVTEFNKRDTLLNYRGGLVLHPVEKSSVYAMVGSSSNPSAEVGTLSDGTASLDPEKNVVYEFGAKADLLEDQLSLGGSLFRIEKTNARVPGLDPTSPLQILDGKQRVQGVNVGGAGTVLEGWKVFASYTFLRSRIRRHSTDYLIGQALPNTPPHSFSLWTTYAVLKNFSLGGGAGYQSKTAVNNPSAANQVLNEVPSFWRFDAFANYNLASADLQLNVANLSNALFYTQVSGSQAVPAEARVVMLTARYRL